MEESVPVDTLGATSTQYRFATAGRYTGQVSLVTQPRLCKDCNQNQAYKIQELNSFEPLKESDFQAELDIYKQQLDVKYKLCLACHDIVIQHLKKQAVDLKTFLLGNHLQQSKSTPTKLLIKSSSCESSLLLLAHLTCVILASLLVCSESITDKHGDLTCICDEIVWLQNIHPKNERASFSSFGDTNATSMGKQLVLYMYFSILVKVVLRSFCERGWKLLLNVTSLTKGQLLHISLLCLFVNAAIFVKRKTRVSVMIMLSWLSLSILRCWEAFWWKVDVKWRFAALLLCWCLEASVFLFSLLSYSRARRTRKKRRSFYQSKPTLANREKCHSSESEIKNLYYEQSSQSRSEAFESLDNNLNGLTLGLPTRRQNGFSTHFGSQSFGIKSCAFSSDEDSCSDSVNEEPLKQNPPINKAKHTRLGSDKRSTKKKWFPMPSKKEARFARTARTFLLISSLLLNFYFLILFTEWPARLLRCLMKITAL
ncbi:uncharacterized protein [Montipora capricornis]|uniref:uncharacterized protein isoform X3 n=1 Tax=Montipora capricornis TaxID=246305 RepID=UPI0035F0FDEE